MTVDQNRRVKDLAVEYADLYIQTYRVQLQLTQLQGKLVQARDRLDVAIISVDDHG